MSERISPVLDEFARPFVHANGKPRPELIEAFLANGNAARRARLTYDAGRDSDETRNHWANSDALDADSANNRAVRHKLMRRSRYEAGSSGFYAGMLRTHTNMVVGVGPKLRMLTATPGFNRLIEAEFYEWSQRVQLRRKLWCMAHAHYQDGDGLIVLETNRAILDGVTLDLMPIEGEQCQTPFIPAMEVGYIDGIRFDPETGEILWYDVLPTHPGSTFGGIFQKAIRVSPRNMLHWFKMDRPGGHRGIPASTSTLNLGASSRRWREAVLAGAESAADFNILLKTAFQPDEIEAVLPMSTQQIDKRMMTALPEGWDAFQMKAEYPSATHEQFNRANLSEQARPLSMPYNAASCDSSTYSFASGKLDTLCYRSEIDVEREDCNDLVLNPLFDIWFREWRLVRNGIAMTEEARIPAHQWDWPAHPVIDVEADARATDQRLKNGTETLREAFSTQSRDYEDELVVMAEDWFGEATAENISLARRLNVLRNLPEKIAEIVAPTLGFALPAPAASGGSNAA